MRSSARLMTMLVATLAAIPSCAKKPGETPIASTTSEVSHSENPVANTSLPNTSSISVAAVTNPYEAFVGTWKSELVQLSFDDATHVDGYRFVVKISSVSNGTPPSGASTLVGYMAREGQPKKTIGGYAADFLADSGLALRWDFKEMDIDGLVVQTKIIYDSRMNLRIDANDLNLLHLAGVDPFASKITGKTDILLRRIDRTNPPPTNFITWCYSDRMR